MTTLAEIEEAIVQLPAPQVEELAAWFERLRVKTHEPDFLARAKAVWGEQPAGKPLSELVAVARAESLPVLTI